MGRANGACIDVMGLGEMGGRIKVQPWKAASIDLLVESHRHMIEDYELEISLQTVICNSSSQYEI